MRFKNHQTGEGNVITESDSLVYVADDVLHVFGDRFGVIQSRVHAAFTVLQENINFLWTHCWHTR